MSVRKRLDRGVSCLPRRSCRAREPPGQARRRRGLSQLRAEHEALSLIHWLREQDQAPIRRGELDSIAADQTLTEPVRGWAPLLV